MSSLQSIFTSFHFSSLDAVILVALAIILAIDAFQFGSRHISILALSLPAALFLYDKIGEAAFLASITSQFTSILQAALFGVLVIISWLLIHRMFDSYGRGMSGGFVSAIVSGLAGAALVAVFWLQVPALETIWRFGPQIQQLFTSAYTFWWVMGSYAVLAFVSL